MIIITDYPQAVVTVAKPVDLNIQQRSIPKIMMSINETIQKMSLKDIIGNPVTMASPSNPVAAAVTNETVEVKACGGENSSIVDWRDAVIDDSTTFLEADEAIHLHHPPHMTVCTSNNSSSCNLQGQPQGKRYNIHKKCYALNGLSGIKGCLMHNLIVYIVVVLDGVIEGSSSIKEWQLMFKAIRNACS